MLKPLTLSLSLAVALVAGNVVKAGGHGHGAPVPSAQVMPTEQVIPSAQGYTECVPAKKHHFSLSGLGCKLNGLGHGLKSCIPTIHLPKPKPKCYTYEWVLKKKRCGGGLAGMFNKCGHGAGEACEAVYPTSQVLGSEQVYAAGQGAWGAAQAPAYGTGQIYGGSGQIPAEAPGLMEPAPVEGDAAPEAPIVPSSFGLNR